MSTLLGLHYVIALGLELMLLEAAGLTGFQLGGGGFFGGVLALVLAGLVIAVWWRFAAPRAARRLPPAPLAMLKAGLFALGAAAFVLAGWRDVALGFAVFAGVDLIWASANGRI